MFLHATNLYKKFPRRPEGGVAETAAVNGVSLALESGDFVTITGRSGSGKTTLLTLLAGLASPSSGTVVFKGNNLQTLSDGDLARLRNREIGFVPQGAGLLGNLTVFDNIRAPQMFSGKDGMGSDRAAFLLDIFEIGELAHEYPYSLSGGEMRRASIARALFNAPSLLVTDEPTGDLDPENTRIVMDMLLKINEQGTAVIVVTHEKKVASLGRRQYTMAHGALRRTGEKAG